MRIVFPEINNPIIQQALAALSAHILPAPLPEPTPPDPAPPDSVSSSIAPPDLASLPAPLQALPASDLASACTLLKQGTADAMIAGIDYSTRDVILACRDHLGATSPTFSASMYLSRLDSPASASSPATPSTSAPAPDLNASADLSSLLVADCAACKHPTLEQLFDICEQTYRTAARLFPVPRLALLSFSTHGSGGRDDSISNAQTVVSRLRSAHPDWLVDGELQLDCAIDPVVAAKKSPDSPVAGRANVLICPDLNSGNILYKSLERFGGYTAAGPLLQGFSAPVSDLSRGSTVDDVIATIKTISKLCEQ